MSIKDFQLLNKLGEGSFSSVWKVKRISDGQEYAMKKVKMASLSEKERQNALNEVRILASIKNPFIVAYKEAFLEDNSMTLCVVMEYAGGGDIYNKISQHQKAKTHFKEQDIWRYAIQMMIGLKTLHDMKILHRDLKCANIFLSADGKTAKLGDLNVSKVAKNDLVYTQTGTPYYASPEVWRDQPYDMKSDIWSLGCVVYEMCALKPPFHANDMQGLFKKVQRGVFDRIPSQYSIDLYNFISMCLQVKPTMRPTCNQFLSHPILQRNGQDLLQFLSELDDENELLGTIKLPKNIRAVAQILPKANYAEGLEEEIVEADIQRGRMQSPKINTETKRVQVVRRPISQNVNMVRNPILVRESQSRESRIGQMQKAEPILKRESEKEYLARMQREYIEKAKAIHPLDLLKNHRSPRAMEPIMKQKSPLYSENKSPILERPQTRTKQQGDYRGGDGGRNDYQVNQERPKSKALEIRKAAEEVLTRNGTPSQQYKQNGREINSREQNRLGLGPEKYLSDRQEYLISKYQSQNTKVEEKKQMVKAQSDKNDILLRKADYLIQKYQGADVLRRDNIKPKEEVKRVGSTPHPGYRHEAQDLLDKYRNIYIEKSPRVPSAIDHSAPVKRVDYQYLNQNNVRIVKKNQNDYGSNNQVRPQAQPKTILKPQWWG